MTLSDQALEFCQAEGIEPDELVDMVRRAARATMSRANRRFHNFVFMVQEHTVTWAGKFPIDTPEAPRTIERPTPPLPQRTLLDDEFWVLEDCSRCEGSGCAHCKGAGQVWFVRKVKETLYKSKEGRNERQAGSGRFSR